MTQKSFAELLNLCNSNSEEALLELLQRFQPLLNKYARKFHDSEEYYAELQLHLISLINSLAISSTKWNEGQIVAYIAKSIYTKYIKLSKQSAIRENNSIEFNPEIMDHPIESTYEIYLKELFQPLNHSQREILYLHYVEGFSVQEIAKFRKTSRQAVNKIKNQALNTLKQYNIQKEKLL